MGTNDILENIIGLRSPDEEFHILIVHGDVPLDGVNSSGKLWKIPRSSRFVKVLR